MIKEEIISFELAKLAKLKGFNIIQKYGNISSLYSIDEKHVYYSNYGMMYSGLNDGYISAPTQTLLQNWFWETYGIFISIIPIKEKNIRSIGFQYRIFDSRDGTIDELLFEHQYNSSFQVFDTPYKALEESLNQILKLI